jgi:hypothetical protein
MQKVLSRNVVAVSLNDSQSFRNVLLEMQQFGEWAGGSRPDLGRAWLQPINFHTS